MANNGKKVLTSLSKDETFSDVFLNLLFVKEELTMEDAEFLFSIAIVFIEEFEKENQKRYYIEFAYAIIVRTCFKLGDYRGLFDFSINFGFYPVARKIFQDKLINEVSFQDILSNIRLEEFYLYDKINTLEQYNITKKILESSEQNLAFIAPTSFGKSEIIYHHILKNSELSNIGIIVPTKALIDQVHREVKKIEGLSRKIIIHDQNYDSKDDSRVLAIVTQERALRLLEQNMIFDSLYIDEAHELFNFDFRNKLANRSILLTRLIRISKELNSELNIYYFSPMIQDVNNLNIKGEQINTDSFRIKNNLKVLDVRYVNSENSEFAYEPHLGSLYNIGETGDKLDYIVNESQNYKKSLHFLYRPRFIEKYAEELFVSLPKLSNQSQSLLDLIEELKEIVHPRFKLIKYLKKGIIYMHGRLPSNIRNYLLKYVREDIGVTHFVANSVVLAGMNLPIDSLFYISGFSNLNDLYNLIGRVNRLSEIFGAEGNIKKVLIPVYFIEMENYPQNANGTMRNKVLSLRDEPKDEVKNPLLEEAKISDRNRESSDEIIQIENKVLNNFSNPDFVSKLTRAGAQKIMNYSEIGLKLLEDIIESSNNLHECENIYKGVLYKVKEIFFDSFVSSSNEKEISYEYFNPDKNVKRLRFDSTIRYYAGFIPSSYLDLRNRVERLVKYWNVIVEEQGEKKEEFGYLQYVGTQFGDKDYNSSDYKDSRAKVYVDIRDYAERIDDLYNLAIIKLQVDDDFVDYEINLLVNTLKEFDIISEEQFNLFVFGTIDDTELKILQMGINKPLYLKLKREGQLSNIIFDEHNNTKGNAELRKYIESKSGIEKFELEQFFV